MRKVLNVDENDVCQMYNSGKSLKDISSVFNCSQTGISNLLKRNGIKLRGKSSSRKKLNAHNLDVSYFENIDSHDKAYWLGLLTADGCISRDGYKATLLLKDFDLVEKFKKSINSGHKISKRNIFDKRTKKTYINYSLQVCSKEFVKNLINQGVTSRKSYVCDFPKINDIYIFSYLRGLLDGDGSIILDKSSKKIRISFIATKEIITGIQEYISDKLKITPHPIYIVSENVNMYKTYYFGDAKIILKNIYENSNSKNRMDRKYEIYEKNIF